ncbi:MAG: tetratricopeptide repeat protein [Candidatus Aminicenantes bacterium]|nr:tetratricopeptide repeat protein [Candidatus Aminicenantes bacterium]
MKNARIFTVIFIILSMSLLWAADADVMRKWEKRLQEASSPSDKVKCLGALMELNLQDAPQKAREYGNQALRILQEFPDDKIKERLLLGICWASRYLGDYREALDMAREAETLARRIDDKRGVYLAFRSYASIYIDLSDYRKALDYALQARKISEELGIKDDTANALDSIASIYRYLKEYEKALSYYKKAGEIAEEVGNKTNFALILINMGTIHWDLKQYQKALDYYLRGLNVMKKVGNDMEIAQTIQNIASVYSETGKYTQALQYDMEALRVFKKIGNKGAIAHVLGNIGRDYGNLGDYEKALDYLDKSLKMAVELERKYLIHWLYERYARIYQAKGDYKNALFYHQKFKETSDEILNTDINKRIAHLQVVYDVEKKEKENQLLKKNNQIQKMQLIFLTLVSVFVFIIALVTHNRYRIKKKTEQVLRASEQQLKNMNAAKDRLFTIIAHDLGSPLNSLLLSAGHLKNHFQALEDQDLEEFIHNIYRQTRDMADLLENLLQWARVQIGKIEQNPEAVDMRLLIEETFLHIKYTAQNKHIRLASHIMENTIAWADKHMMKAVMRNLLSNAVKYSHPGGEIQITSIDAGNRIEITVSDNGVGMGEEKAERLFKEEVHESTRGTSNEKGTGLGLVLCKEFVEKNGGEIRVQSQLNSGSHFTFTLPKQG